MCPGGIIVGTVTDLALGKAGLIAENALLCQQRIVLCRQVKEPRLTHSDRLWFLVLASRLAHWKQALLIIPPDILKNQHG